jgi:hypothetical protein
MCATYSVPAPVQARRRSSRRQTESHRSANKCAGDDQVGQSQITVSTTLNSKTSNEHPAESMHSRPHGNHFRTVPVVCSHPGERSNRKTNRIEETQRLGKGERHPETERVGHAGLDGQRFGSTLESVRSNDPTPTLRSWRNWQTR